MSDKEQFLKALYIWLTIILSSIHLTGCAIAEGAQHFESRVSTLTINKGITTVSEPVPSNTLRVISLNIAHGRGTNFSQFFTTRAAHKLYLQETSLFLKTVNADIVALQEVDSSSLWSGNFDHLDFIANQADFPRYIRTNHVKNRLATYGTGLMSKPLLVEGIGLNFRPSPPTTRKGLTLGNVLWPHASLGKNIPIDVISVHLDFSRESVRKEQINDLIKLLKDRPYPKIIMGDFNSEWLAREFIVENMAKSSPVKSYQPESDKLDTYNDKRLDWILISRELEFVNYRVDNSAPSDHKAVIADIRLSSEKQ